ncbi:hypothetical protein ACNOYE_17760 [Nannocystaceae bacterium ST9]
MKLAELLEREAIADGDQVLAWARERAAALLDGLGSEDPLRSLLGTGAPIGAEADSDAVPVARRRRREPSSPQPKSADELPPPPEHPGLAEGEPEPVLETVDTGPIDLEEEIVRRRLREDSWAIAVREVDTIVGERANAIEVGPEAEASIEVSEAMTGEVSMTGDVPGDVTVEPEAPVAAIRADSIDSPLERPDQPSQPELPVVVGPVESSDLPMESAPVGIDITPIDASTEQDEARDEDFEVDELVELEVDELVELDEEIDEAVDDDVPSAPKPPRPPPPRSAPPPIRNEVASLIAELSEPVRTGETVNTRLDDVEGAPPKASPESSESAD